MLLRSSRTAEKLTKEALLAGLAAGAAKGVGKAALTTGGMGAIGAGAVGIPAAAQAKSKANVGMSNDYINAQKYGLAPQVKASF